jgi:hypothetical protein
MVVDDEAAPLIDAATNDIIPMRGMVAVARPYPLRIAKEV